MNANSVFESEPATPEWLDQFIAPREQDDVDVAGFIASAVAEHEAQKVAA